MSLNGANFSRQAKDEKRFFYRQLSTTGEVTNVKLRKNLNS